MSILNPLSWFTSYNEYHISIPNADGMNYWSYCNGLNNFLNSWLINNNQPHLNGNVCGTYTIDGINYDTGNLDVSLFIPKDIKIAEDSYFTYQKILSGSNTSSQTTSVSVGGAGATGVVPIVIGGVNQDFTTHQTRYSYDPYINVINGLSSEKLKNKDVIPFKPLQ